MAMEEEDAPVPRKRRASVFDVETAPIKELEAEAAVSTAAEERQRNVRIASPRSEEWRGKQGKDGGKGKKGTMHIYILDHYFLCFIILDYHKLYILYRMVLFLVYIEI